MAHCKPFILLLLCMLVDVSLAEIKPYTSVAVHNNFMRYIGRADFFHLPPKHMRDEVKIDHSEYQPVIGILTQPTSENKLTVFNFKDYILEINHWFIKWAGSKTIAIPYNISDEDLKYILPQINGVLFTGGSLNLVCEKDPKKGTGKLHKYMRTAKKIVDYSRWVKDQRNEEWPILGIC